MIVLYMTTFLIKVFLICVVYQDLSIRFDLLMLNIFQIIMIVTFLLMLKLTIFGISYADIQAFKQIPTAEKIVGAIIDVLLMLALTAIYFFYTLLL